jgi:predicted RNase H-like nuclease (RuvC/YqgF family)
MMRQIGVPTSVVLLGLLLSLTGCGGGAKSEVVKTGDDHVLAVEQESEKDKLALELQKAEDEEQELITRMEAVTRASDRLQKQYRARLQRQVDSLELSRDGLQAQINDLTESRSQLLERISELMRSRDEAAAEAHQAQKERDALQIQLAAEAKTVSQLQEQLKQIRELQGTIEELQSELAKVVKDGAASPKAPTVDSGDAMVVEAPAGPD